MPQYYTEYEQKTYIIILLIDVQSDAVSLHCDLSQMV